MRWWLLSCLFVCDAVPATEDSSIVDGLAHQQEASGHLLHLDSDDKKMLPVSHLKDDTLKTDFDAPDAPELDSFTSGAKEQLISTGLLVLVAVIMLSWFVGMCCRHLRLQFVTIPFIATLCGLLIGIGLKVSSSNKGPEDKTLLQRILALNEDVFFMTILPPIIFDSGFSLKGQKAKEFFDNFGTVLWFALLSTFLSFLVVGAMMYCAGVVHLLGGAWSVREAFAFGALISATDPVSVISLFKNNPVLPLLETLVSGESLMNDALSIVLYRTIAYTEEGATFLGLVVRFVTVVASSVLIGVVVGLTSTALARYTVYARDERASLEFSLLLLFPWISYLLSDGLGNSGIVSILFCAVVMAQYTVPLLSSTVQESASAVSASASLFAESAAFVFLGLGEFSLRQSMLSVRLVVSTIVVVSFARVVSVWVTTLLVNRLVREHNPITSEVQSALIISGLRGSCAFALAMHARHDFGGSGGSAIVSATLVYSIFTIMIVGPASYPCFHALRVFISPEDRQNLSQDSHVADVQLSGRLKLALMKVDDILRVWLLPAEDTIEPEHHCQSESAIGAARGSLLPVYGDVTIELR